MKKLSKSLVMLCVLSLFLLLSALSASAQDNVVSCSDTVTGETCTVEFTDDTLATVKKVTNGVVYRLNATSTNNSAFTWNFTQNSTAASLGADVVEKLFYKNGESRVDTGVRYNYEYNTETKRGVLTLYAKDGVTFSNEWTAWAFPNAYMKELVVRSSDNEASASAYDTYGVGSGNYAGGYFEKANVKEIVIGDGITAVPTWAFNYYTALEKVTVTEKLTVISSWTFSRCNKLNAFLISGREYEQNSYILDFSNIKSTSYTSFSESFQSWGSAIPKPLNIYLGSGICSLKAGKNTAFGYKAQSGNANHATGTINCYTPTGTSCPWIEDIASRGSKYNVNVFPMDVNCVTERGWQIRVKAYNGLRGVFGYDESSADGISLIKDGVLEANPEKNVPRSSATSYELIEYGAIVVPDYAGGDIASVTKADYGLTLDSETLTYIVPAGTKAKKVSVWSEGEDKKPGTFVISIVRYSETNLKTKVFMTGYEILKNSETGDVKILYSADTGAHIPSESIYDVTIGMYTDGLINHSVEEDNVFWSVLEPCRETISFTDTWYDETNYTYYSGDTAKTKVTSISYTLEDGGKNLRDKTNSGAAGNVLVSVFKVGSDGYTAIARPANWQSDVTFYGGTFTSEQYSRANFLSEKFIGVPINTLVIDEGIGRVYAGAVSGFQVKTSNERKQADGTTTTVYYTSSLSTIIYSASVTGFEGQAFVGDSKIEALVRFNKDTEDPYYVKNHRENGIFDIGRKNSSGNYLNYGTSYVFSSCPLIKEVLLPLSSTQKTFTNLSGMFAYSTGIKKIYAPDSGYPIPADGTADFRGTGWKFDADIETCTGNATFRDVSVLKVINDDGTRCSRETAGYGKTFSWDDVPPELSELTIGGVPLANYTVTSDEGNLIDFTDEVTSLQSWITLYAGSAQGDSTGEIVLKASEDIGFTEYSAVLEGSVLTITVNPYGVDISVATEYLKSMINERESETITAVNVKKTTLEGTSMLENTYYKLTHDKALNVTYLGGSITYGQGATSTNDDTGTCWTSLTTKWLRESFPNAVITPNNAGIQDTTSDYGLFRLERDVFSENIPDLLFIEYTSNDGNESPNGVEKISARTESIIRLVREKNPYCDVIFIYTKPTADAMANTSPVFAASRQLSEYYGLIQLPVGEILYNKVMTEDLLLDSVTDRTKYGNNTLSKDSVHPTDAGYALYMKLIGEYLNRYLVTNAPQNPSYTADTREALNSNIMLTPNMYNITDVIEAPDGWTITEGKYIGRGHKEKESVNWLSSSTAGAEFTFTFTGNAFGLMFYRSSDGADIEYSVDGGKYTSFTIGALYNHMRTKLLEYNLASGTHTVTVRVKGSSAGSVLNVIKIMVNGTMTTLGE